MNQKADPNGLAARLGAEALGTFILVFGGVGTAVYAAGFTAPSSDGGVTFNVGFLGVAIAFGLTLVGGIYALGPVSGGHFNPAVTVGLAAAGRFSWKDAPAYWLAQIIGGVLASSLLYLIATGSPDFKAGNFASNGYDAGSPGGYGLLSVGLLEIILTGLFVIVILGVTSKRAAAGFAPLAIGLTLTLVHLIGIPVSNTSVNPARSIASAVWGNTENTLAIQQLWAFIVFPVVGALIAGYVFKPLLGVKEDAA